MPAKKRKSRAGRNRKLAAAAQTTDDERNLMVLRTALADSGDAFSVGQAARLLGCPPDEARMLLSVAREEEARALALAARKMETQRLRRAGMAVDELETQLDQVKTLREKRENLFRLLETARSLVAQQGLLNQIQQLDALIEKRVGAEVLRPDPKAATSPPAAHSTKGRTATFEVYDI